MHGKFSKGKKTKSRIKHLSNSDILQNKTNITKMQNVRKIIFFKIEPIPIGKIN